MIPNRHTWGEFLTTQSAQIPLNEFIINLLLTALFAFILGRVDVKFGRTLSNRDMFASNFVVLAMTTMLIISIVKSSLALSLGLVGGSLHHSVSGCHQGAGGTELPVSRH